MKCKFIKKCKYYSKDSVTCMKDGGMYYVRERPAGCWRDLQAQINKIKDANTEGREGIN